MSAAPAGKVVSMYCDLRAVVEAGHAIRTQTGRTYLVVSLRQQTRGKHVGRWHLRCLVLAPDDPVPTDAVVHGIRWYKRARKV